MGDRVKLNESFEKQCTSVRNLEFFNQLVSNLNEIKAKASSTHHAKYAQSWLVDSTKSITDIWTRSSKSSQQPPLTPEEKLRRNKELFVASCLAPELRRRQEGDEAAAARDEPMDTGQPPRGQAVTQTNHRRQSRGSIDPSSSSSSSATSSVSTEISGNSNTAFTTVNGGNGDGGVVSKPTVAVLASTNGVESSSSDKAAAITNGDSTDNFKNNGNGDEAGDGGDNHHDNGDRNGDFGEGDGDGGGADGMEEDGGVGGEDDVYKNENRGLYCVCERSHQFLLDGQTRMCDACNSWYHVACVLPYTPASQAEAWSRQLTRYELDTEDDQHHVFICPLCSKNDAEFGKRYETLINHRYEKQLRLKLLTVHSVQPSKNNPCLLNKRSPHSPAPAPLTHSLNPTPPHISSPHSTAHTHQQLLTLHWPTPDCELERGYVTIRSHQLSPPNNMSCGKNL